MCVCGCIPTMQIVHLLFCHTFTSSYLQHTVCIPRHTPTTMQTHPAPCPLPPLGPTTGCIQCTTVCFGAELQQLCSIRQKCIRRRSQALGGFRQARLLFGSAAHRCSPPLIPTRHATCDIVFKPYSSQTSSGKRTYNFQMTRTTPTNGLKM